MSVFVAGATGATGRLLTEQLLDRGEEVRVVVRSAAGLPRHVAGHERLRVTEASLLDLSDAELRDRVAGCTAVASCLGHNLTFRGMFGAPRRLVADAVRRLCEAIRASETGAPVRFVLMNTTGNRNRDLAEKVSVGQSMVIGILRLLLPPVSDNEQAAEYLRRRVGQDDPVIQWSAVRPDTLVDSAEVTAYAVHPSPIRDAIFDSGKTSRINVADFMAELATSEAAWNEWKGRMPVIYDTD
jgi:nucleoside-diphosphate-sugar epimerase